MTTSTASSSPREPPRAPQSAAEVRSALDRLGLTPSRRLGQSFLIDPYVADAEAALLEAATGERVVEIGGGLGVLTEALQRRGLGPITVVETDRKLARHLRDTFGPSVEVLEGDALGVSWPAARFVVGNLPFSTGTPILQRLWRMGASRVVVLLQKEVVDRITATPGSKRYGRLSVQAALYGAAEAFQVVPSSAFEPPPAVEGRLLRFEARAGPPPVPSVERFEAMMRLLFSSRRKQLGNLLPRVVHPPLTPEEAAEASGWPVGWARLRPENLPPEAFFHLATTLAGPPAPRRPAAR